MVRIKRSIPDGNNSMDDAPATTGKLKAPTRRPRSMTAQQADSSLNSDPKLTMGRSQLKNDTAVVPTRVHRGSASFHNSAQDEKISTRTPRPIQTSEPNKNYRILSFFHEDANHKEDNDHGEDEEEENDGSKTDNARGTGSVNAVRLNPDLFNLINYASHPGAVVAYFAASSTLPAQAVIPANNTDYITDGPVKKVRITVMQTITFEKDGEEEEIEVLRRYTISSLADGITVSDVYHLLGHYDCINGVVGIRTELGSNSYIEIFGAVVQE